jgi:hypothetical protein
MFFWDGRVDRVGCLWRGSEPAIIVEDRRARAWRTRIRPRTFDGTARADGVECADAAVCAPARRRGGRTSGIGIRCRCGRHRPHFVMTSATRRPSRMLRLRGFSQQTSLPAFAARIDMIACQWSGVEIMTASMSLSASRSRKFAVCRASFPSPVGAASPVVIFNEGLGACEAPRVDVAHGRDLRAGSARKGQVAPHGLSAAADHADVGCVCWARSGRKGAGQDRRKCAAEMFEECAARVCVCA